jgi:hypothetical protein
MMMPKIEVVPFLKSRDGVILRNRKEGDKRIEVFDGKHPAMSFANISEIDFKSLRDDGLIALDKRNPGTTEAERYTISDKGLEYA